MAFWLANGFEGWPAATVLLAAADAAAEPQWANYVPFIAVPVLLYLMMIRPAQQEKAQRDKLLNSLKKNDRVVTVGGIVGTVANVAADGKEVTLKVDDNTRIRFVRESIVRVLVEESTKKDDTPPSN